MAETPPSNGGRAVAFAVLSWIVFVILGSMILMSMMQDAQSGIALIFMPCYGGFVGFAVGLFAYAYLEQRDRPSLKNSARLVITIAVGLTVIAVLGGIFLSEWYQYTHPVRYPPYSSPSGIVN